MIAGMPRFFPSFFKTLLGLNQDQLIAEVQFLKAENEILRRRLPKHIRTKAAERARLIRLGKPLGSAIKDLITIVKPKTFAHWVKQEGRCGPTRKRTGRPPTPQSIQELVIRIARESGSGYTKIKGELNKLGIRIARNTIKNILKRRGITPDPHRGEGRWHQFIKAHAHTLWACDFFCINVWTLKGLRQCYLLLFIHIGTRRLVITRATEHPTGEWVNQQARNFCMSATDGHVPRMRLLHDQDAKLHRGFDEILRANSIRVTRLPRRSPDLNAFAETAVRTVKHDGLNNFVVLGEKHLNHLVQEYVGYYNRRRPHSAREHLPRVWMGLRSRTCPPMGSSVRNGSVGSRGTTTGKRPDRALHSVGRPEWLCYRMRTLAQSPRSAMPAEMRFVRFA